MTDLSTLPSLKSVIGAHGLDARKSLGQHFLLDSTITGDIARYAGDLTQCNVIEIGPGPGGLTRSLLMAGAKTLTVIEKDERCLAALAGIKERVGERLNIISADALQVDLIDVVPAPRKIVANLPYNAGTAMLIQWLEDVYRSFSPSPLEGEGGVGGPSTFENKTTTPHPNPPHKNQILGGRGYESMTLMFQKEVAERITAAPGCKDYGRLSVLAQWLCECRWDIELPPEAFSPPPKVSSAVITLTPREKPLYPVTIEALELVVAKAFGQRRKMLRSALKGLAVPADILLEKAGIDGTLRAEQLDVMTLCRLADAYLALI